MLVLYFTFGRSILSFGISEFGEDLEESSFFSSFSVSVCVILLKQKVLFFFS